MTIREMGERSKAASYLLQKLSQTQKNDCLKVCADALKASTAVILSANEDDIRYAKDKGMPDSLIDRLKLTPKRIEQMADGLMDLTGQKDPVGEIISSTVRPNGLEICQKRVPIGTIGIIYESRPNVTADAFGLCFKTANTVILKGGSDAINSNQAIVKVLREAISSCGIPSDVLQLVTSTDRKSAMEMMRLNGLIDVLIPRGGEGLIRSVVENATVPVIETGTGNCHIYVDEDADLSKALPVIINAKTQRTGVCNACESLIFHEAIAADMLPQIAEALFKKGCVLVGDERSRSIVPEIEQATEEDWGMEYLDLKASVKIVSDLSEAIAHINQYNTGHSESIITENYTHARRFLDEIDAACVYVNASTRFTDGGEFGFGAEIGISTQKLHARGPMGLVALTTTKYVIYGDGQIRG